jgi:beta-glucosidase
MTAARIERLLEELTLDEKIDLVHGTTDPKGEAVGYVPPVERLDIPALRMVDGPLGVRLPDGSSTAFPASISLASTWDPTLAREQGTAMGREVRAHGQNVLLGPGTNLIRAPNCGRNFEYYSEDPQLSAAFAAEVVAGIQSEDVIATVKHYVANNQEKNRYDVSADVSERALREIYLPSFRAAVEEADAGSVMTSYNRVNGTHMSDHRRLLTDVLKDEFGFDGFVMSDWYGVESTAGAARAGLDLEMPGQSADKEALAETLDVEVDPDDIRFPDTLPDMNEGGFFDEPLREAVESGEIDESVVDEKVHRILGTMDRFGLFDDSEDDGALDTPEHRDLAREIAVEGTVLLRNDGALPLSEDASLAVLGPNADEAKLGGGGSSEVTPFVETSPVDGLRERAAACRFERGVPRITESSLFDEFVPDRPLTEDDDEDADADFDAAVDTAAAADCAVVVVQDDNTESKDRDDIGFPGRQDELVEAVADAADRTVVVLRSGGPVELPWVDDVDAVVQTWYPGQADGDALAAVLYGDADPGGRLPVTFAPEADYPTASEAAFPGVDDVARYDEGVFVGYRHFDRNGVDPTFPFGHGRSYADFEYGEATVKRDGTEVTVNVPVSNVAEHSGTEVVQVYVREDDPAVPRPDRELGGFEKIRLAAGERETVSVTLDADAFAYYDEDDGWTVPSGEYTLLVGRSSRDVRETASVTLD